MATKSMLKQIIVKSDNNCRMLANALEHSCDKKAKHVEVPKPHNASVDDAKKMLGLS